MSEIQPLYIVFYWTYIQVHAGNGQVCDFDLCEFSTQWVNDRGGVSGQGGIPLFINGHVLKTSHIVIIKFVYRLERDGLRQPRNTMTDRVTR